MRGRIYGIGVGTGDPEDITLKAIRLIKESDVLACPRKDLAKCRAYFEESNIEGFSAKLERLYPDTEYVNTLMTHSWGQRVIRFYDPDGNLIEVGTPM